VAGRQETRARWRAGAHAFATVAGAAVARTAAARRRSSAAKPVAAAAAGGAALAAFRARTAWALAGLRQEQRVEARVRAGVVVEAARRLHARARAQLIEAERSGLPFILFLRNFEYGQLARVVPTPKHWDVVRPMIRDADRITMGAAAFAPLIQVANVGTIDLETDPSIETPTLWLGDEDWRQAVDNLIRLATLVVVRLAFRSTGVDAELRSIERLNRSKNTVLITPSDEHRSNWKIRGLYGGGLRPAVAAVSSTPS
jgi:hypothetical protein